MNLNNVIAIGLVSFLVLTSFSDASARNSKRDKDWEASFKVLNSTSSTVNGAGGSDLEIDSDFGWGITLGYNYNSHLLFNYELTSLTPDYDATLISDEEPPTTTVINHELDVYHSQFNAVYNFSKSRMTPYIQAGLGWSFVDSNVADSPPEGVCWWHPWWGYICDVYQTTYDDTLFSYNVAAGFRYELDSRMFIRASYQQIWMDLDNSDAASTGVINFEFGSTF